MIFLVSAYKRRDLVWPDLPAGVLLPHDGCAGVRREFAAAGGEQERLAVVDLLRRLAAISHVDGHAGIVLAVALNLGDVLHVRIVDPALVWPVLHSQCPAVNYWATISRPYRTAPRAGVPLGQCRRHG